jgi:hypothetical protein
VNNESSAPARALEQSHVTPITSASDAAADPSQQLPETARLTAATIRAWRDAGYRVNERRVANWLYVVVRGNRESAVYKVIGPFFQAQAVAYQGVRVA